MNLHETGGGGGGGGDKPLTPRSISSLQGPRPPQLRVNKDSHKIRKPPQHPEATAAAAAMAPHRYQQQPPQNREPVIIYAVSPKIIHTRPDDFRSLVQRLTGLGSSSALFSPAALTPLSPATAAAVSAAAAASPTLRQRIQDFEMCIADTVEIDAGIDRTVRTGSGGGGGILSPLPSSLPPISPNLFLPSPDPSLHTFLSELSPTFQIDKLNNAATATSSFQTQLSPVILSPGISFEVLINQFLEQNR